MSLAEDGFIRLINDPKGRLTRLLDAVTTGLARPGRYGLCIGSTAVSDLEGISAAGADAQARRATPAIDAEALVLGRPLTSGKVPVSPAGIVSPVVISRAMINLVDCAVEVFDCGAFHPPQVAAAKVGQAPAQSPQSGQALPAPAVHRLFRAGQDAGARLSQRGHYLVVGECVPGGTTTALGVLTALGYKAAGLVSSSMPSADNDFRRRLVEEGLRLSGITSEQIGCDPLLSVAAVGDPMQPFAAGLAEAAARHVPVVLGGGTQMLAVYALLRALLGDGELEQRALAVVTTKWVAFDSGAGAQELARLVGAPFAAACPNFKSSRHPGLQAYEEGNVKEGVGAGAMMALASLSGFSHECICQAIDLHYERMVVLPS